MQALAIGRNSRASFACSLVLLAVLWYAGRPGDTHGYKVTHVSLAEAIALIAAGAFVIDVREGWRRAGLPVNPA